MLTFAAYIRADKHGGFGEAEKRHNPKHSHCSPLCKLFVLVVKAWWTHARVLLCVSTAPWKDLHMHMHKFSICGLRCFCCVFTSGFPHWLHATVQVPVIAFNQLRVKCCSRSPSLLASASHPLRLQLSVTRYVFIISHSIQSFNGAPPAAAHAVRGSLARSCSSATRSPARGVIALGPAACALQMVGLTAAREMDERLEQETEREHEHAFLFGSVCVCPSMASTFFFTHRVSALQLCSPAGLGHKLRRNIFSLRLEIEGIWKQKWERWWWFSWR